VWADPRPAGRAGDRRVARHGCAPARSRARRARWRARPCRQHVDRAGAARVDRHLVLAAEIGDLGAGVATATGVGARRPSRGCGRARARGDGRRPRSVEAHARSARGARSDRGDAQVGLVRARVERAADRQVPAATTSPAQHHVATRTVNAKPVAPEHAPAGGRGHASAADDRRRREHRGDARRRRRAGSRRPALAARQARRAASSPDRSAAARAAARGSRCPRRRGGAVPTVVANRGHRVSRHRRRLLARDPEALAQELHCRGAG